MAQEKKSLGLRVRDSVVNVMYTDILEGLRDVVGYSEFIEGGSPEAINVIKECEKEGILRHTQAFQYSNGNIWVLQVTKKNSDGRLVDKVCYAHFSREGQQLTLGQRYSNDEIDGVVDDTLKCIENIGYSFNYKQNKSPLFEEALKRDNIYIVNGMCKEKWVSPDDMLGEVYCTLVSDGRLDKAKQVNICYDGDGFCRVKPVVRLLGENRTLLLSNSAILKLLGINEPAKDKYMNRA